MAAGAALLGVVLLVAGTPVASGAGANHFVLTVSTASPTAGAPVNLTITAEKVSNTTDPTYAGSHVLTFGGALVAPAGNHPTVTNSIGTAIPFGSGAAINFTNGVATVSGSSNGVMRLYKAESANITVTDGSIDNLHGTDNTGTGTPVTVAPATPATLRFTGQPTETCVLNSSTCGTSSIINDPALAGTGVQVEAKDAYGNPATNTSVKVAIDSSSDPSNGTATLGGTKTQTTNVNGIFTFTDLTIDTVGVGYKLLATAPPISFTASWESTAFTIAQSVTPCHGSSCAGTASQSKNTVSVNGTGIDGTTLGIALIAHATPPSGVCGTPSGGLWVPDPDTTGTYVDVNGAGSPSLTVTWRLDKTVVQAFAQNGASHYDVCLGAVYLADPGNGNLTGFPTKFGVPATPLFDQTFQVYFYWGVLPDCPKTLTSLTNPCVISRNKTNAGDEIIKYFVADGWDATGHLGGT